jgi:hypothetical protein
MQIFMMFYDLGPTRFLVVANDWQEAKRLVCEHLQSPNAYIELEGSYDLPGYTGPPSVLKELWRH